MPWNLGENVWDGELGMGTTPGELYLIVSRHPAAEQFLREHGFGMTRCVESATADDVRGKVVGGNLPLHLAALACEVRTVEFTGTPPRGAEYTLADMYAAGAHIARYRVSALGTLTGDE